MFATHGRYNPYLVTALPEHMEYPMSCWTPEGIDLDYSALMTAERFIIDQESYEFVIDRASDAFAPMKHSLKVLHEEGFLVVVQMEAIFVNNKDKIITVTKELLRNPTDWLGLARAQWQTLKPELVDFQDRVGSSAWAEVNTGHQGVDSWLARTGKGDDVILRQELLSVLEGRNVRGVGIDNVRGILEFVVAQIVMSDLAAVSLGEPILDWADSSSMYERLYSCRWTDESTLNDVVRQSRSLFAQVIPDLKPGRVEDLVKFFRTPGAVSSLRQELIEIIDAGGTVDEKHLLELSGQLIRTDLANKSHGRTIQRIGGVLGLAPWPWMANVAIFMGNELLGESLAKRDMDRFQWYIALQGLHR